MAAHPDDGNLVDDLTLVQSARAGDRLAFGVLYLRHHAAAWRLACVASRFSPDAELAVIEAFTRVFSALPAETDEFGAGGVTFRPYLLACVRQAALERASAAGRDGAATGRPGAATGRGGAATGAPGAPLAGLGPDGEVVLSSLEHHVARGALAALPERSRTALWLSDVEAMTPGEVAGILGGDPQEMAVLAAGARSEIHTVQQAALGRQEVRAGCRFTVDRLDAYEAGMLDPTEGLIVRSHLSGCPPCRMRQGELSIAPAALAGSVPAAPLLGGEAQHHWLAAAADARPAARLLPPVLAAGGAVPRAPLARRAVARLATAAGAAMTPARGVPAALRRAGLAATGSWRPKADSIDLTTRPGALPDPIVASPGWTGSPGWSGAPPTPPLPPDWTIPPGRAARNAAGRRTDPGPAGRARRGARAALPAMALVASWVLVMMALPRLMAPATAPGPGRLTLPAVQAYVPGVADVGGQAASGSAASGSAASGSAAPAGPPARGTVPGRGAGQSAAPAADDRARPWLGGIGRRFRRRARRGTRRRGGDPAERLQRLSPSGRPPSRRTPRAPIPGGLTLAGPAPTAPSVTVAVTTAALPLVTLIPTAVSPSATGSPAPPVAPQPIDQPGSGRARGSDRPGDTPDRADKKRSKRPKPAKPRSEDRDRPAKKLAPADRTKPDRTKASTRTRSVPQPRLFSA